MTLEGYIRLGLALVLLIIIAVILFKFNDRRSSRRKSSLEIMKERYENGEISKETYEEAKRKQKK